MLLKRVLFWLIMSLSYFSLSTANAANLTLNLGKTGNGQVYGEYYNYNYNTSGSGISCGASCTVTNPTTVNIESGSTVQLSASANDANYVFKNWTGSVCNNTTSNYCQFVINQNPTNLTANFRQLAANRVKISRGGLGLGKTQIVGTTNPANASDIFGSPLVESTGTYSTRIKELSGSNTWVIVKATADTGYTFGNWTINNVVGCTAPHIPLTGNRCKVKVNGIQNITATFNRPNYTLTLQKAGNGLGTVTNYDYNSSGSGIGVINCAPNCTIVTANYPAGEIAQLQAQAAYGSKFDGWVNCPNSSSTLLYSSCETTPILANRVVTAKFKKLLPRRLELSRHTQSTGTGGITNILPATPAISCYGGTCIAEYSANTTVTLQANPTNGSVFAGWTGCTPVPSSQPPKCTVLVNGVKQVSAKFMSVPYVLTVTPAGSGVVQDYDYNASGSGIIINCGSGNNTCNATLNSGSSVTLSAQPNNGAQFIGWGGDGTCTGTDDTCYVLMNSSKQINANFTIVP